MKEIEMQPLYDNVMIDVIKPKTTTPAGLVIPESAQEKQQLGKIVAKGEGKYGADGVFRPLVVDIGDKVLFPKFAGLEISYKGTPYLIIREQELLAVIKD